MLQYEQVSWTKRNERRKTTTTIEQQQKSSGAGRTQAPCVICDVISFTFKDFSDNQWIIQA